MDDYGRRVVLDVPFQLAVAETSQVLREEGLDIVARFDVREYSCARYITIVGNTCCSKPSPRN